MAQNKPRIDISPPSARLGEIVYVLGAGFTPNRSAISHLLRPDRTEYNPLRLRIDPKGEFTHRVDTTMLQTGTFEVWVDDEASKTVSNHARFAVES